MTGRALPRSRLDALIPSLVAGQALVALVPATGDATWAAGAAWDVARAAALGERRVALVDLGLEHPTLHQVVGLDPSEGIVDAFEYDVSLTKAARQVDRVFFIGAGAVTAHAGDLFANPRWRRLHGGFRSEDALLLLYLPAGALARLSTVADGLLVLSPDGYEAESSIGQGIAAAMERGIPLLGVVRERWTGAAAPPPGQVSVAARGASGTGVAGTSRRAARPVVMVVTLAAGAALGWALLARGAEQRDSSTQPAAGSADKGGAPAPSPPPPAPNPAAGGTPAASPALAGGGSGGAPNAATAKRRARGAAPGHTYVRRDSLVWTVQLAAYARLDRALALAGRLSADGETPFVTPVTLGPRRGGAVWYRVLAGGYRTREAAVAARGALWDHGLAQRGQGDVLRAPYSYALSGTPSVEDLRARGIPALAPDSDGRWLVGAFETPEQGSVLEARLKRAGVRAKLVTRLGATP